ncbi:MAG: N-6 DNA methylase, partial [Clostridium sp.]|nr:N-6 DNA methylase [Clostridium sp.]
MTQVFEYVLGYATVTGTDGDIYNQKQEYKSVLDTSEADGGLGFFSKSTEKEDVRVVIELKDARTPLDKKQNRSSHLTPVEQAFSYANKNGSRCGWVIVSNFVETRLYKSNSSLEYEVFDLREIKSEADFLRFYFLLCKEHLICEAGKSLIDELYRENEEMGIAISNDFYKTYKEIRDNLYADIKKLNPDRDSVMLFTKTQKIMDRFTFICFCEDYGLLPQNIYKNLVASVHNSFSLAANKLWNELKGLFASIDKGNPPMKVNRYNGGLFKADLELDELSISDEVLEMFLKLTEYDFGSDLNVNILGQIFEQSISDVEQIKNEIKSENTASKGKQKDDGIFYTPYYVTRYIVEQTVGVFLNHKKEELKKTIFSGGVFEAEVRRKSTGRKNTILIASWEEIPDEKDSMSEDELMHREAIIMLHQKYWQLYEEVLKSIKICDPACGSGAFLNQCFDYLHEEMDFVLEMKFTYDGQRTLFDIDKEILQNNLYGVDINPESVEITKLSLWLKTAKRNQTLASLDANIKCGDSIVADKEIAAEAFVWREEFPQVFAEGGFDIVIGNPPYGATLNQRQKI